MKEQETGRIRERRSHPDLLDYNHPVSAAYWIRTDLLRSPMTSPIL
jgi:hypothetical protein